jgi:hypothetical protein
MPELQPTLSDLIESHVEMANENSPSRSRTPSKKRSGAPGLWDSRR